MDIQNKDIIANIFKVMNTILFIEKKNTFQFKGIKLFPKEIHLLLLVSEEQNINAKTMAERLNVTKGAISQTLLRLENKGILKKTKDPYNKNEISVFFTPLGIEAVDEFKQLKASLQQRYDQCLSEFSANDREAINKFLKQMNTILKSM